MAQLTDTSGVTRSHRAGRRRPAWLSLLLRTRLGAAGCVILLVAAFVAAFGPMLMPGDPNAFVASPNLPPSSEHVLGTTGLGQDVLHQLVIGTRATLAVALVVGLLTSFIAAVVAMSCAYFGGLVDEVLSLLTNVFLILPGFPLMVVLAVFLPSGTVTIALVLSIAGWAFGARYLRSQALSVRERDFVSALIVSGERPWRIMFIEILPNMLGVLTAYLINQVVYAIGAQASLEFLGLGAPNQVTWGTMLYWAANNMSLLQGTWWTFVAPGMAIAIVSASLTLVNYVVDEAANPRLRASRSLKDFLRRLPRGSFMGGRATVVAMHE
jgi:peptide/nickel transport system permease protein